MRIVSVLCMLAGCTEIPDPAPRVKPSDAGVDAGDGGADAGLPPCEVTLNLHIRGATTYFATGPVAGSGAWGNGGPFQPPDTEWLYVDAYAAGIADELRGHIVPLGAGKNAKLETATHWLILMRNCQPASTNCPGGAYYPSSGRILATRAEAAGGTGFELQLRDAVFRPATLTNGELVFSDAAPEDCIAVSEMWIAGKSISIDNSCAANPNAYFECVLAQTADQRHPD